MEYLSDQIISKALTSSQNISRFPSYPQQNHLLNIENNLQMTSKKEIPQGKLSFLNRF